LVGCLCIGERFGKLNVPGCIRPKGMALDGLTRGVELHELERHLPNRPTDAPLGTQPLAGAKPRHCRLDSTAAVAGDPVALIDRDVQLVALGVFQEQVFALDAVRLNPDEAAEAGDAVVDVDDVFTGRQAGCEGKIVRTASSSAPTRLLVESEDLQV